MPLPPEDLRRLMARSSGRGHTGGRNRALVTLFAHAGLGVGEALALTEACLRPDAGAVRVLGPRSRTVAVDPEAMSILQEWAGQRRALGLGSEGPLFCTRAGLPLEASYVRRLIARLAREAGIAGVVNARVLRESYAAARITAGASAEELRAELGHATIASTQRFVRQMGGGPRTESLPREVVDALLAGAHCGLAVLRAERDGEGTIRDFVLEYVNPAAAAIMGLPAAQVAGTSVRASFPRAPADGTYARWIALIEERRGGPGSPHEPEDGDGGRSGRIRRIAVGDRIVMSLEGRSADRPLALIGSGGGAETGARRAS